MLNKLQINLEQFYIFGMGCFSIIAVMNFLTLFYNWELLIWTARVGSFFSTTFNVALVFLFHHFYLGLPKVKRLENQDDDFGGAAIEKHLKELE